ncbi:MAG TPA: thioredoxin domain-containing protein [Thermoanaerobaculia bacterium]|nr:thioredoxin domain-containing protein [Thermoanaerobaculia bacterium]
MDASDRKRAASRHLVPSLLMLALALGFYLPACSAQDKNGSKAGSQDDPGQVLARVNGKAITARDVHAEGSDQFDQLEREYLQRRHEIVEAELKKVVQDRLLDAEAAAQHVSKDKLLAGIKPGEVTDADAEAFYEKNKARIPPQTSKESVMPQIKAYLAQNGQQDARDKYFKTLEAKYKVDYLLEPMRVDVAASGPAKGPAGAPVTIVEFSDFQCPFCSRITPTLEQVVSKYGNKVRLVFRQFPLPMHPNAAKAAEAALCANEQGKFWEMHDAMFKDQAGLAVDGLKSKAAGIAGINAASFNSCLDSGKQTPAVQSDMKAGTKAGVNGTPAMFINGRFVSGVVSADDLSKVIDEELKRKGVS